MANAVNAVSGIRTAANVLTLIGAILQTIIAAIIIVATLGFGAILGVPLIILAWIAYNKTKHFAKGWNIYGIVQSACLADIVGLTGYILALVDLSNAEHETIVYRQTEAQVHAASIQQELQAVNAEIAALKQEL